MNSQTPTRSPPVFLCPTLAADSTTAEIRGDEAKHGIRVRRLRVGDPICLINGRGLMADGRVISLDAKGEVFATELNPGVFTEPASPRRILASALPRGERQATMLDMATQLGMDCFIPLNCEHSVVRYQQKMATRWQRIVESACKQSRRSWFPVIDAPETPSTLLTGWQQDVVVLYGDHRVSGATGVDALVRERSRPIVLMIGPEGGFSPGELELLRQTDCAHGISIGRHVLRTETAAVALLAHLNACA